MRSYSPLLKGFRVRFPSAAPCWHVRAPGRINLIGEHTDYNGHPVLPIALDRAVRMIVAASDDNVVQLANAHPELYPERVFTAGASIPPFPAGDWGNYAKAAVVALCRLWGQDSRGRGALKGMRCMVDGDVPPAAGLASSSALVVASALAFASANGRRASLRTRRGRAELADVMAQAEHYVGTQGGGMDQAVCLLAREGCALRIDFFPLRANPVRVPRGCVILAAHSTVQSAKAQRQRLAYNRRVLECNIGRGLLARRLGMPKVPRLGDLCGADDSKGLKKLTDLLSDITRGRESLGIADAAALFGLAPAEFAAEWLRMKDGSILPTPPDGLKVLPRCRHIFSEAARVVAAAKSMKLGDTEGVGRLMNESHRSCAADYEISTPELDQLTELMLEGGALGARLTGAGFGGFAIALVGSKRVGSVRKSLAAKFYRPRRLSADGHVFAFHAAAGAQVDSL